MIEVESARAIRLEPQTEAHSDFLRRLFGSTREEEMGLVDWNEERKAAFLAMQFHAQTRHYSEHFPDAVSRIVLCGDLAVGRLCTWRGRGEIRIVDIALLPRFRGRGIGTELIGEVLRESDRSGLPIRIHVEKDSLALRLYQRLGFLPVEDAGFHWRMERSPSL